MGAVFELRDAGPRSYSLYSITNVARTLSEEKINTGGEEGSEIRAPVWWLTAVIQVHKERHQTTGVVLDHRFVLSRGSSSDSNLHGICIQHLCPGGMGTQSYVPQGAS